MQKAPNNPKPSGIGLDSLALGFWAHIYKDAVGLTQENPKVFLVFGLTHLVLPSDFHRGRGLAVGAHPCLAAAGCPEVVDEPLGEISGVVAAVSDVRSKSRPLPIFKRREKRDQGSF